MLRSFFALLTAVSVTGCGMGSSTPATAPIPHDLEDDAPVHQEAEAWEEADPDDVEADLDEMPAVPPAGLDAVPVDEQPVDALDTAAAPD
jgi:hypothetical protein